jgi:hypothetical protein
MNLFSRNKWNEFILMGERIPGVGILLWFSKKKKIVGPIINELVGFR